MKILVLGGTLFVGRAIVEHAVALGHDVTMFNRGQTNPTLFPDIEHIVGDRNVDVGALAGRSFDAVIDTSGYFPRQVSSIVEVVGSGIDHYTFLSSVSVYADHDTPDADEEGELTAVADPDVEAQGSDYGGFKALCERTLEAALPGRVHCVRAGLIAGPYDSTRRFGYWVERLATEDQVLAPEPSEAPVQIIDVRDLAEWILESAEAGLAGAFNATGPSQTFLHTLEAIKRGVHSRSKLVWATEAFLVDHGVEPWTDLPLWLPPHSVPGHRGFMQRSNARAAALGLVTRPIEDTAEATLEWLRTQPGSPATRDYGNPAAGPGLAPDRQRRLLDAWERHTASH